MENAEEQLGGYLKRMGGAIAEWNWETEQLNNLTHSLLFGGRAASTIRHKREKISSEEELKLDKESEAIISKFDALLSSIQQTGPQRKGIRSIRETVQEKVEETKQQMQRQEKAEVAPPRFKTPVLTLNSGEPTVKRFRVAAKKAVSALKVFQETQAKNALAQDDCKLRAREMLLRMRGKGGGGEGMSQIEENAVYASAQGQVGAEAVLAVKVMKRKLERKSRPAEIYESWILKRVVKENVRERLRQETVLLPHTLLLQTRKEEEGWRRLRARQLRHLTEEKRKGRVDLVQSLTHLVHVKSKGLVEKVVAGVEKEFERRGKEAPPIRERENVVSYLRMQERAIMGLRE